MDFDKRFPEGEGDVRSIMVYLHELRGELQTLEAEMRRIAADVVAESQKKNNG